MFPKPESPESLLPLRQAWVAVEAETEHSIDVPATRIMCTEMSSILKRLVFTTEGRYQPGWQIGPGVNEQWAASCRAQHLSKFTALAISWLILQIGTWGKCYIHSNLTGSEMLFPHDCRSILKLTKTDFHINKFYLSILNIAHFPLTLRSLWINSSECI